LGVFGKILIYSTTPRSVLREAEGVVLSVYSPLYRAVDKFGDTIDFMLSERRDEEAATAFFKQAINSNGLPEKVVMLGWRILISC